MADKHVWSGYWSSLQQFLQIVDDSRAVSWSRHWITPTLTGAVIPANFGELRDTRLDHFPSISAITPTTCFKNHGWGSAPGAVDVHCSAANVNALSNSEWVGTVSRAAD